jgi:hypothetical protein
MCAHQGRSYGSTVTSNDPDTQPTSCIPRYEIRVTGRLGSRWAAWFDGLNLTSEDDGVTLISGAVVDQAALHGLLAKLRDLGIPLVSLAQVRSGESTELRNLENSPSAHNPSGVTP